MSLVFILYPSFIFVFFRASVLKTVIKSKNHILRQLNQVVNISFLLTGSTKAEEAFPVGEKLIRCHATARWSRSLQKDTLNLTCVLNNSSPYVLERGWTLSIAVFPLSHSSSTEEGTPSTHFSFPFLNLGPGETFEVSLPVAAAGEASFPLTVNCSLILSLSSFLGEEEEEEAGVFPSLQTSCFSLPLNTLTVDWLNASQVISPTALQSNKATYTLQDFLSSRQIRCSQGDSSSKPERYSAIVRVSSELLRETLTLKSFDLETRGLELASQNLCFTLLDWLLFEDYGGVKMGHGGDEIDMSSLTIQTRAPNGAAVQLTAKEVNLSFDMILEKFNLKWKCSMNTEGWVTAGLKRWLKIG